MIRILAIHFNTYTIILDDEDHINFFKKAVYGGDKYVTVKDQFNDYVTIFIDNILFCRDEIIKEENND